jgi:hypothetical protein
MKRFMGRLNFLGDIRLSLFDSGAPAVAHPRRGPPTTGMLE